MEKIDFVVLWVDSSDKKWSQKKQRYEKNLDSSSNQGMNGEKAFRDYGLFKYWFRGVEQFAPWVNHVFLVTDHQVPQWLNEKFEKLRVIDHSDFLPPSSLPVFNSNAIEVNIHRIPDLSENFVLFNDDMFLISKTKPEDFFIRNKPRDIKALFPIKPEVNGTSNFQINDMKIINKYFTKHQVLHSGSIFSHKYGLDNVRTLIQLPVKFVPGFFDPHGPISYLKTTFRELWTLENEILQQTTNNKFRTQDDVSNWLFRYWQLAKGEFEPRSRKFGKFVSLDGNSVQEICEIIKKQRFHELCINDGFKVDNFDSKMANIQGALDTILPEKSSFEL
ncbi:MAG TPA: Stealth CR1 domain-containing protein [Ligilactobacillus acidipiscis]|uniref:Stealth CR1 domain-containing protein n=1 Tax=Ligilactobacillus acidipiscis TaxID=89059 RepID=A0A921K1J2_9LACO|nr:Stealth CR1 domain-containing protein [Ligilactobacillus acidipiscis]